MQVEDNRKLLSITSMLGAKKEDFYQRIEEDIVFWKSSGSELTVLRLIDTYRKEKFSLEQIFVNSSSARNMS